MYLGSFILKDLYLFDIVTVACKIYHPFHCHMVTVNIIAT